MRMSARMLPASRSALAPILACLAVLALAAPCPAGAAPKKVVTHYHWAAPGLDEINQDTAKRFMAVNPGVEINLVILPDGFRRDVIRTVIASGRPIDSFGLSNGESAEFLAAGQAVPLLPGAFGKKSVDEVLRMWTAGAVETCGGYWEGRYYGIPFELSNYVAWINTADMREAGLDPARDKPQTWDQFVEVGRRLTKVRGGATVRNGFMGHAKWGVPNFLVLLAMMEQLGLDWGTEKGLVASMDRTDVLARGLKTYTDFVTASRIWDPSFAENDRAAFLENRSAMCLTAGSWLLGMFEGYPVKPADVEPFPYPRFTGGRDIGGVGYGYCLYVSPLSRDKELAFRFVDALASRPDDFIRRGYYQPRVILSDGSPGLDAALASTYIPHYDAVFKAELTRTSVWLSSTKGEKVTGLVWEAITRVIYRGFSVEDSVAALQRDIRALLK